MELQVAVVRPHGGERDLEGEGRLGGLVEHHAGVVAAVEDRAVLQPVPGHEGEEDGEALFPHVGGVEEPEARPDDAEPPEDEGGEVEHEQAAREEEIGLDL